MRITLTKQELDIDFEATLQVVKMVYEFFGGDELKQIKWWHSKQPALGNKTPWQAMIELHGDRIEELKRQLIIEDL